jgi:acyl-CoA reductase-like NAD-dependent aldehyde dehydrogenase
MSGFVDHGLYPSPNNFEPYTDDEVCEATILSGKTIVTAEAVEAAARAAAKDEDASNWDDEPQYYRNGWLNRMQTALEAAAPFIAAKALEATK